LVIQLANSMRQVTVAEAKAQLSTLLDAEEGGEPVLITRRGAVGTRSLLDWSALNWLAAG
jgi:PHD/YefM family antitoxin component YafN of YafNO toxin-antitoxin module